MTAWVKGLFPARSPGETPRLFSAAEGCNIKALQLNPTPHICHFPLTPKIKGHGTLRFYPVRKNKQRGRFDNYWITLHLVQLVHEILLLVLLNLFRHPSGRLTEHPVQVACHRFLPLFLSLCVGLRCCLLGGVNIRRAVSGLLGSLDSVDLILSECDIFLTAARAASERPVLPCSGLLVLYTAAHTSATAHRDLIKHVHRCTLTSQHTSCERGQGHLRPVSRRLS